MSETTPRRDSNWVGWGDPARATELPTTQLGILREEIGELDTWEAPSGPEAVPLPDAEPLPAALTGLLRDDQLYTGHEDRLRHATGSGYTDLARLRLGEIESAPDAVLTPESQEQIEAILKVCSEEGIAVVPFGGGTSVVGGVAPLRGAHGRLISLDLRALRGLRIDATSLTARLGAGFRGPEAEAALGTQGFTLGHFPQSFEYATIGGFAATRSAGQASSGYGRFDSLVSSVRMVTPTGTVGTLATPHSAAGPALREVILGSEGTLGVIPDVDVRIRPKPPVRRYEGWIAEDFQAGTEIVRAMAQGGALPDIIRVSDTEETRISLSLSGPSGAAGALFERYLGLRGRGDGALIIVGLEGEGESVERRRALAARKLRSGGAVYLGRRVGASWEHGRYNGPYFRDTLMGMGAMVETLETSHTWSSLHGLHASVGTAISESLRAQGTPGIVFCHLSHAYPDGASLYFTFISRRLSGSEIEQWRAVKVAACEAIVKAGATITHHHATGSDHAPYMEAEIGSTGIAMLRAVKAELDPSGIMNPGKLLP